MRKNLLVLSSFMTIATATVTNVIATKASNNVLNTNLNKQSRDLWDWYISNDCIKYDLTKNENETLSFDLPDLLVLFKQMQKVYLEENVNIGALFNYYFVTEEFTVVRFLSYDLAMILEQMFSNKDITFNNVSLLVSKGEYHVQLNYSEVFFNQMLSQQEIELFSYLDANLSLKYDMLNIGCFILYNNH